MTSVTDIVVGAFRFIVNEPDKDKVGITLLKLLEKVMWSKPEGNDINISERGICIRPVKIKSVKIQADVEALTQRLESWSKED